MLPDVEHLLVLQDRDGRIAGLRSDLERIPAEEAASRDRLDLSEKALEGARHAIQENEVAMKNLELDIETRRNSITRLKQQQYETRKNEEYRTMGEEIERYGEEIRALEDQELELMEKGEVLKEKRGEAQAQLDKTKELVDGELAALTQRRVNFEGEIAELTASREELAAKVDDSALDIYERLFSKKGGTAVVPLVNGQCGGCHVKVVKATVVAARAEKELAFCENCGRIVYYSE